MNYEKLEELANLLNKPYVTNENYGFIIAPFEESVINLHRNAMIASNDIFNYEPAENEKVGIMAVSRESNKGEEESDKSNFSTTKLEHMDHQSLITPENELLVNVYLEYIKSSPTDSSY